MGFHQGRPMQADASGRAARTVAAMSRWGGGVEATQASVVTWEPAAALDAVEDGVVAVAVHDGFYGAGTGAGWSNRALLEILAETLPATVDLVVLPVRLDPASQHHQKGWHGDVVRSLRRWRRRVVVRDLDDGTDGLGGFGELGSYRRLARTAAAEIALLRRRYRRGLVIFCDVPFSGAAALVNPHPGWVTVVIPRSSAALHIPDHTRLVAWERGTLRSAARSGVLVGAISGFMRTHLVDAVGIPSTAVVDVVNGLCDSDCRWDSAVPVGLPTKTDDGFWLSFGRAVPEKGFEDLIDALCLLRDRGARVPHVVLAAVSRGGEFTPYQRRLADLVTRRGLDVTFLTRFSPRIRALLTCPSLTGVVVPSRVEPFGRIPLDAYAAGAAPVVATTAGGLRELVRDGVSGFTADPNSPESLAAALHRAATVSPPQRQRMRLAGREILGRFDYRRSVVGMLNQTAPWLGLPSGDGDDGQSEPARRPTAVRR